MQKIRTNIFETNSSSCHSLAISSYDLEDKKTYIKELKEKYKAEEKIIISPATCETEFGWGIETYTDFETKAMYCYLDGVDKYLLKDCIEENLGKEVVFSSNEDCYIDHNSSGTAQEKIKNSISKLEDFLFNPNSILVIDNDNH